MKLLRLVIALQAAMLALFVAPHAPAADPVLLFEGETTETGTESIGYPYHRFNWTLLTKMTVSVQEDTGPVTIRVNLDTTDDVGVNYHSHIDLSAALDLRGFNRNVSRTSSATVTVVGKSGDNLVLTVGGFENALFQSGTGSFYYDPAAGWTLSLPMSRQQAWPVAGSDREHPNFPISYAPWGGYRAPSFEAQPVPLSFDELVARYTGFGYDFNGYIDVSPTIPDGALKSKKGGLGCSGFASIILQRLGDQSTWETSYDRELHQYLGTRLPTEDLHIGKIDFTQKNVANVERVFTDGIAQQMGLGSPVVLDASDVINGEIETLSDGQLYFFSVQRWKANASGRIIKDEQKAGPSKYIREGHVGFVRPNDGLLRQWHYSSNNGGGLKTGEFPKWLRTSVYNPDRPTNKAQRDNIRVYLFAVDEPVK